ncbi:MAG: hypothetical protein ABFD69_13430 [Candidatus Sumerlaeia bacterium]
MLGLGIVAAVPGYRFGFKAKPFTASILSIIGQGVIWRMLFGSSMGKAGWVIALALAVAVIYALNLVNLAWTRIRRRPFPWLFLRVTMWVAAALLFVLLTQFGPRRFNLFYWAISLWIAVLPPLLQGLAARREIPPDAPPAASVGSP